MNTADKLQQTTLATPLGKLTVVASPRGVQAVLWPGEASAFPIRSEGHAAAILRAAADQLGEYFSGQRTAFDLPLDLLGTPFQIAVWEVLRGIPLGPRSATANRPDGSVTPAKRAPWGVLMAATQFPLSFPAIG